MDGFAQKVTSATVQYRERSDRMLHTIIEIKAKVACSTAVLRSRYCTSRSKLASSDLFVQSHSRPYAISGNTTAVFLLLNTINQIPPMIITPPTTVRQLNASCNTIIPRITATTGVTKAINIDFVTSMFCTNQ